MADQNRPEERRRRPQPKRPDGVSLHIDLGFGEVFKGFGNFLELATKLAEEGQNAVHRTGELHGPGETRAVYGFSIKTGVGGQPTVERFGNVQTTDRGPSVSEVREPLVDVFDEEDHILVVAELPGVADSDVRLEAKDDILTLSAAGRNRKYAKEILLPSMVNPASLKQSFSSGILEVRLDKAAASSTGDGSDDH